MIFKKVKNIDPAKIGPIERLKNAIEMWHHWVGCPLRQVITKFHPCGSALLGCYRRNH